MLDHLILKYAPTHLFPGWTVRLEQWKLTTTKNESMLSRAPPMKPLRVWAHSLCWQKYHIRQEKLIHRSTCLKKPTYSEKGKGVPTHFQICDATFPQGFINYSDSNWQIHGKQIEKTVQKHWDVEYFLQVLMSSSDESATTVNFSTRVRWSYFGVIRSSSMWLFQASSCCS